MKELNFTPIEETVSFYTRNDFAIVNNLLIGNYDELWIYAELAYNDNRGIIAEYEKGVRRINGDYDVKWLNCLKRRLIDNLDEQAKAGIIRTAKSDIENILGAMSPTSEKLSLFRTAWIDKKNDGDGGYSYSREYKSLQFNIGDVIEINTLSSFSLTPYRENDDVGSDFYRYEIIVPVGKNVLPLDKFITHNEDGEVLLPPMKCKVVGIRKADNVRCRSVVELEYLDQLPCRAITE